MWRWLAPIFGLAFGLAALWLYSAIENRRAEARFPPIGTFVEVAGVHLHYLEAGSGPPVILIHGASVNLRDFKLSIFDRLARTHRVLAFDRPGLGYSEAPQGDWCDPDCQARLLHDALIKLGVEKPVIVGHSWGAAVAMAYGLDFPDEIAGVLDLSGAVFPLPTPPSWYNRLAGTPLLGPILLRTLLVPASKFLAPGILATSFAPNKPPAALETEGGLDLLFRPESFAVNARNSRELSPFLARQAQRYPDFRPPLIIMFGVEDHVLSPIAQGDALKKLIPHADLYYVQDVGHGIHYFASDDVIRAIDRLSHAA